MAITLTVNGMTYMINPIYDNRKTRQFLSDLIHDGCEQFDDLHYSDLCEFAALLIEASGPQSEHECITNSCDLDKIMAMLKRSLAAVPDFNENHDDNLVYVLKESVVSYYTKTMEELFNTFLEDYETQQCSLMPYSTLHSEESYQIYRDNL